MTLTTMGKVITTGDYSTPLMEEFVELLHSFQIKAVVDIRYYPASLYYPHFHKEVLEDSLPGNIIQYFHLNKIVKSGKVITGSRNALWRYAAFRRFADYLKTDNFKEGIKELENITEPKCTAYMCPEALWWRCKGSMVSDYLNVTG